MNTKAQAAVEYTAIIALGLFAVMGIYSYYSSSTVKDINRQSLENTVSVLKQTAETISSLGYNSFAVVDITIPNNILMANVSSNAIYFTSSYAGIETNTVGTTNVKLRGALPFTSGKHKVMVKKLDSGEIEFSSADNQTVNCYTLTINTFNNSMTAEYFIFSAANNTAERAFRIKSNPSNVEAKFDVEGNITWRPE